MYCMYACCNSLAGAVRMLAMDSELQEEHLYAVASSQILWLALAYHLDTYEQQFTHCTAAANHVSAFVPHLNSCTPHATAHHMQPFSDVIFVQ